MKSLSVILIVLLMASLIAPLTVRAQPAAIPHEDPQTAQSTINPFSFLSQYVDIFELMATGKYNNASQLSEKLSQIDVPDEYRYIINRYNDLTQQLINTLSNLDGALNNASTLLDQYRIGEARQAIDNAGILVAKAQILLNDLKEATSTLSQRLGIFSTPLEDKARQAYTQLESMLDRLNALIERYYQLLQAANQRIEGTQKIIPTILSINLDATERFVGSTLQVSGTLSTTSGQQLRNRAIQILIDGDGVTTVNTATDGSYHKQIQVPYKYVDHISIQALYTPQGSDRGIYQAALSPIIQLKILYYKTNLNVIASSVAYPGLTLVIQANVTSQDANPLSDRQVRVLLDGTQIGQSQTDTQGGCIIKYSIQTQAKLGNHTLTVKVDPSGTYADTAKSKILSIQKRQTTIELNSPSVLMLPGQLQINGSAHSTDGPLKNANIKVEFANALSTTKTSNDGNFNITIDAPISIIFAGNQELKVTAQPSEPWQATTQKTTNIFVLNYISIAVAVASSLAIIFMAYSKYLKNSNKKRETKKTEILLATTQNSEDTIAVAASIPQALFEGTKGRVLKAYLNAVGAIQSVTGENLTPNITLREYLKTTTPKMGKTGDLFSEITALTETSLYSTHQIKPEDAEHAEELANNIRRSLTNGNP